MLAVVANLQREVLLVFMGTFSKVISNERWVDYRCMSIKPLDYLHTYNTLLYKCEHRIPSPFAFSHITSNLKQRGGTWLNYLHISRGVNKVCIIFSQEYDFDALSIRIAILNYQKIHRILTCKVNSFLLILWRLFN